MRRLTVNLSTTIGTALVLMVVSAGTPAWTPYHQDDVTVTAARSTCAFDVRETVVAQHEQYLTTRSYSDGTPRTQIFTGAGTTGALHADGTRSYRLGPHGTAENLCTTLAR